MSDYSDMASRVRDYKDELKDEHERATRRTMREMKFAIKQKLRANDSVARNVLVSDVQDNPQELGDFFTAHSADVPLWSKYVEHGTGSRGGTTYEDDENFDSPDGWADIGAIERWIVNKSITPRYYDTQSELARAIARTIGEIGTFAHPFLRPVWFNDTTGYQTVIDANADALLDAWRNTR